MSCSPGRCPSPPAVDHADRRLSYELLVGSTVTYFCRHGYMLIPGVSPTTTCLTDFTWSAVPALCQSECSLPFALPTAIYCPTGAIYSQPRGSDHSVYKRTWWYHTITACHGWVVMPGRFAVLTSTGNVLAQSMELSDGSVPQWCSARAQTSSTGG